MSWFTALIEKYPVRLFLLTGFLLYFYSLFNAFVGDDFDQVVNNTFIHSLSHLPYFFLGGTFNNGFADLSGIYYKPVMTIFFSVLYTFFQDTPFFYHLTQLLFHIANTILCFYFFQKFFPKTVSFFAAFIFLIHPINTESVVYVSGLQDVLCLFFGLLGLTIQVYKKNSVTLTILVHILFLLSLLSKETGVVFLGISLLYELIYFKKRVFRQALYVLCVGVIYALLRIHAVGIYSYHNELFPMMHLSLSQRLLSIPLIILSYCRTFVFPFYLAFAQNWIVREMTFSSFFLPLSIVLVLLVFLGWLGVVVMKKKLYMKQFYFFTGWFFISLSLHLQIIPLDSTVADRWFYVPIIGLLGIVLIAILQLKRIDMIGKYILSFFLLLFFLCAFFRSLNWQNQYVLYGHDVAYNQDSYSLLNGWASELMNVGKYTEAEPYVRKSIALEPRFCYSWNNLGSIYAEKKDFIHARQYFQTALQRQGCPMAYNNLATLLYYHFSTDDAYSFTTKSLQKLPTSSRLWLMLALIEHKQGKKEEALTAAKRSYRLSPSSAAAFVYTSVLNNKSFILRDY